MRTIPKKEKPEVYAETMSVKWTEETKKDTDEGRKKKYKLTLVHAGTDDKVIITRDKPFPKMRIGERVDVSVLSSQSTLDEVD